MRLLFSLLLLSFSSLALVLFFLSLVLSGSLDIKTLSFWPFLTQMAEMGATFARFVLKSPAR